jgi:hypothetical protein
MQRREALKKSAMAAGSALMVPSLFALLQSCQETSRLNWKPQFLSVRNAELVSSLVDTILPKTETPGALDMKVDIFIDLVYGKLNTKEGQEGMAAAMEAFDAKAKEKYGSRFADLSPEDKSAMLKEEEANSPKYNGSIWGTPAGVQEPVGFYRSLKSLALWGYFSSEEVGKNILTYDPVPGPYQGCIPLADVGKTYSL